MIKSSQTRTILPRNTTPHTNSAPGYSDVKVSSPLEIFGANENSSQLDTSPSSALFCASRSQSQDPLPQQNSGRINTPSTTHPTSTNISSKRGLESSDDLQEGREKRARPENPDGLWGNRGLDVLPSQVGAQNLWNHQ